MSIDLNWWDQEESDQYNSLFLMVKKINSWESGRRDTNLRCARLYGNSVFSSLTPQGYYVNTASNSALKKRMSLNVIANMADTMTAKMSKINPKIAFLTEGGDAQLQQKAKKLQKFVAGQFYANSVTSKVNDMVRDCLIFDVGVLMVAASGNRIVVERVMPDEIKVDPEDSMYGTPSHLYRVKYFRKSALKAMFPKFKDKIELAISSVDDHIQGASSTSDLVAVIEGWHIKSGDKAKDGKHIIAVSNCTLLIEDWDKETFPFVFLRWSDRLAGFHGQSLADRLTDIQIEINKILRDVQTSMNLFAIPHIMCEYGSKINRAELNNTIAHIVNYANQKPTFETPPVMHQQVFDHLDRLERKAYEITGISQLSATSRKPSGLDAAVALREYQDIESERFLTFGKRVEQTHIDIAKLLIDAAKDVYNVDKKLMVNVKGKEFIEKIKWAEIDLEDDAYMMKLYAASSLPEEPAGRLAYVMEMLNLGMIPKDVAMSLLEFPDTEAYTSLLTAATEDIQYVLSKMIEDGEYMPPEPAQNLVLGIQMVTAAYLRAKNNGIEESRLELLRNWIEDAMALTNPPQPEAPTAPIAGPTGMPAPSIAPGVAGLPSEITQAPQELAPLGLPTS